MADVTNIIEKERQAVARRLARQIALLNQTTAAIEACGTNMPVLLATLSVRQRRQAAAVKATEAVLAEFKAVPKGKV